MRFIEHIVEPDKLLLSWQSPDGEDKLRRFVAELTRRGDDADLVYLKDTEDFSQAVSMGFEEYKGLPIAQKHHANVLSCFMKRLPPRSRRDFDKYLASIRISPGSDISDFALLGYSGAKLPDDNFTIVHPFSNAQPPFELLVYSQGYRYWMQSLPLEGLHVGMKAQLEVEPDNPWDPNAVCITINGLKAGYVSRGLATQVRQWMREGHVLDAAVERINGTVERPSLFLYLTVRQAAS